MAQPPPHHRYIDTVMHLIKTTIGNAPGPNATPNTHTKSDFIESLCLSGLEQGVWKEVS